MQLKATWKTILFLLWVQHQMQRIRKTMIKWYYYLVFHKGKNMEQLLYWGTEDRCTFHAGSWQPLYFVLFRSQSCQNTKFKLLMKASFWEKVVKTMARATKKFPQTAYVVMKNSLQMEWQYVHRTVSDAGTFFDGVEEAIASEFLPSLFGVDEDITCKYRKLADLPVRHGGLSLSNPTTTSKECDKSSTLYSSHPLSGWQSWMPKRGYAKILESYRSRHKFDGVYCYDDVCISFLARTFF